MSQSTQPSPIRVAIVDDDAIVRETLSAILGQEDGIAIVATATNGSEAVDLVHERIVDVVLMDIQMPVLDGVQATSRILAAGGNTRVLLLTTFDDDTFLDGGITAGASGFLLKTTPAGEIAAAIRTVHAGGKVLSPGPTSRVLERYVRGQRPSTASDSGLDLSARELEVLRLLRKGYSNRRIAREMNVAETTVKTHVSSLMRKMGAGSRLEVVAEASERGIG
ncbi:response regulator transcription factor [Actinomyces sp.]|uniref:response regulator transcription factor n=1 Tax=Actinomyces sp. TaxID=29317 RepID=UPI0026DDB470|nr:response regulator transcription factor [Actinomyces sp.]MDO4900401.1 response regulator transcription factor [Actinomyces sp.]